MYFWDIESLKEDIRRGEFGDKELLPYIVISVLFYSLAMELTWFIPSIEDYNQWDIATSIIAILSTVAGTIYVYKKNGGAEGNNFANKYFSIGFVVGLRFLFYFFGFMILLGMYFGFVSSEQEDTSTTFVEVVFFFIWYVWFYYSMGKHTEETNTIPASSFKRRPKKIYKILKWFSVTMLVFLLSLALYFLVPYYNASDDLNKKEASEVLNKHLEMYCEKSYIELTSLIENESNCFQIKADSGTDYQIEVQIYTDEGSDDLVIFATIDNGNRSAYHPVVDTIDL